MFRKSHFLILFITSLLSLDCAGQQDGVGQKDDPVIGPFSEKLSEFLGDSICDIMLSSDHVEAYLLKEWETDPSPAGFHSFKVIDKIDKMSGEDVDSLIQIISSEAYYGLDGIGKKCEFGPNIGFRFVKDQTANFSLMISLNCDVLKYIMADTPDKTEDCDRAHEPFLALGQKIFPENFEQTFNEQPITDLGDANFDLPLPSASDSTTISPTPIDSTSTGLQTAPAPAINNDSIQN